MVFNFKGVIVSRRRSKYMLNFGTFYKKKGNKLSKFKILR